MTYLKSATTACLLNRNNMSNKVQQTSSSPGSFFQAAGSVRSRPSNMLTAVLGAISMSSAILSLAGRWTWFQIARAVPPQNEKWMSPVARGSVYASWKWYVRKAIRNHPQVYHFRWECNPKIWRVQSKKKNGRDFLGESKLAMKKTPICRWCSQLHTCICKELSIARFDYLRS